jgi:hypothetical protein
MKIIKTVMTLALLTSFSNVYADGGTWRAVCTKVVACPAGQTGSITLSTGANNDSGQGCVGVYWGNARVKSNTCKVSTPVYKSTTTEYRTVSCPEGQTGAIQQKRTFEVWTDGSIKNLSGWSNASNTCAVVPTQDTERKDGVEEVSCDSYYGAVAGSYSGSVYSYGEYVSSYNSGSMKTNTVFNVASIDTTSCKAQTTDMTVEYKSEGCGPRETGSKKYFRYKAINSKSEVAYPYGDWAILNNTCTAQGAVDNTAPIVREKVTGLLSNMHFTSSRLMVDDSFSTYLNNLAADGWAGKERHKLTISINDLSNGSYDAKKISSIISKFQSVVGAGNADVKIVLPRSIDKLVGNGNITAKASASKSLVLKSIRLVGINAVVNYVELTSEKVVKAPMAKEIKIQVLSSGVNLSRISSE